MDKLMTVQGVATRLFATEAAIDNALVEASRLMSEMMTARQDLRIAATVGDDATGKLAQAITLMSQARHEVVGAHRELDEVKLRLGIRTKMIGSFTKNASLDQANQPADLVRQVG